jgi:putrescine transport system substrate-binding protein
MRIALSAVGVLVLAACGGGQSPDVTTPQGEEKVLHVYNWTDYIGPTTIADFEARTGIRVHYDTYDSNEILETKLLTAHTGYDIVFPTSTIAGRLARVGALRKLDTRLLPNIDNLDPEVMRVIAIDDPGNAHAISYMWGTTGLGYNPQLVRNAIGIDTIDSLSTLFDPAIASKLARCGITVVDSPEDIFDAAEIYLGTSPGNEDLGELAAAETLVMGIRPYIRSIDSTQHVNALASGDICLALSWSNLILQARDRGAVATQPVKLAYAIPKEGATLWSDTVAIPADAPHPNNAHAFLDFLMDPEVIASISNFIESANGNSASVPHLRTELRDDPSIYPPAAVRERLHPSKMRSPEYSRAVNRAWTRIKTGQ